MNSQLEIKLAPTPETDDATLVALDIECGGKFEAVHVQVSKRLERERDEWKAKYIQQNKDLGCEMMDPNGTIWDYAKKVQRERDEAREYADKLAQGLPDGMLPKDVDMLREANLGLAVELAEARGQIEANHKAALVIERMVYEARDQRDRLAENLERALNATVLNHRNERWHIDGEHTLQLLQSLTQN